MKTTIAFLALATALASPAFGTDKGKNTKNTRNKPETSYSQTWQGIPFENRLYHSPNPSWDVYRSNGQYVGSDPDPHVRAMIRRDIHNND